jgi:DNA-binding MarR family transcriptional regulator
MLDKLHEEGLVERRAHPTDRRVRTLWLTPGADRVVDRILDINLAIREEAFAGLASGTRDAMIAALGSVKDNLMLREEAAANERSGLAADLTAEPLPADAPAE